MPIFSIMNNNNKSEMSINNLLENVETFKYLDFSISAKNCSSLPIEHLNILAITISEVSTTLLSSKMKLILLHSSEMPVVADNTEVPVVASVAEVPVVASVAEVPVVASVAVIGDIT